MTINDVYQNYILNDGKIISCNIDFVTNSISVILEIRKSNIKHDNSIIVEFIFSGVTQLELFEDCKTEYYSDITLSKLESGEFYISLDPYGNSNLPNENDNFTIIAKDLFTREISEL